MLAPGHGLGKLGLTCAAPQAPYLDTKPTKITKITKITKDAQPSAGAGARAGPLVILVGLVVVVFFR